MDIGTDVLLDKVQARIAELLADQPQANATHSQSDGVCAWDAELVRLDLVVQSMTTAVHACSRSQSQLLPLVPLSHTRSRPLEMWPGSEAGEVEHCHEQQGCVRLIAVAYTDAIAARLEALLTNGNACAPKHQHSGLHCVEPQSTSSHSKPLSAGVSPYSRRQYRAGLCSVVMWALRYERTLKLVCGALGQYQTPAHLHGWRHAVCSLGLDACKVSRASTGWGLSVPSLQGSSNIVVLHCGVLRVYCGLDCTSAANADSSIACKRNGGSGVGASSARGGSDGLRNGGSRDGGEVCSDMEMAVRVSRLQGCEVLRSLSCDQLLWLAAAASTARFSAGERVIAAADASAAPQGTMAVILDGSVILSPHSDNEHIAAIVTRLGPSDSFLLASCLLDEPVGVSIRAATCVQVCLLPAEHVRQLLRQDAAFRRETASALRREMETYSAVTSAPHAARPAPGVGAPAGPHSQAAEDAISARLAARVGARSALTALHSAAGARRACMSGLKESLFADEFEDVFYSDSRPCLVVVLLGGDVATRLDAGAESGSCTRGDPSRDGNNTFLLRFGDPQTAQAWAEALRKCVWRRGDTSSAGVGDLRRRKDVGAIHGEQDRSMLNNLASLIAFGSSPSTTRQSVDLHVSGIFAKHVIQDDREIDLHGLFLGCKECVTALESALSDLDLASSQIEVAKEVTEVYLASMFAKARLLLTATSPQHQNRKWTKDLLCLLLTELPLILDKWALAESVGPLLRTLAHGPVLDRLTSCYMDCMQASLHKLFTNLCLREERLYSDDMNATDATGEFAGVGKAGGGDFGGGVAQEGNGRVRSYLVEDLSCVIERELDLCAGVESREFQNSVHATCLQICLDVVQKHRIFGRQVSGPDCVGHGAAEESKFCQGGVQGLSDTVSTSSLASSFHSSTSTTAFASIFTSSAIMSPARGSRCSASITLRAACMALNNVSDSCRMCDRLQDRLHYSLQERLDHSLKSPGPGAHPERVLSKLHEHFLVSASLAEAAVVDACICRLTAARFFGDVSGCWERISEDEEARYREIEALLVDVSNYLSEPLCQRDCRHEEMNDDSDGGLRFARKEFSGDSQGRGPETGSWSGPREVRDNVRESDGVDRATARKHISYWARRICARVLDFLVMFHIESIKVLSSSSQCPPLQTVINTLESVFKAYLEEFIIVAKLKPLRASLDLLTCSPERIKERVAQHLEDGVHVHVCRNSCVCRDLRPEIASQIDTLLRGSEDLMSTCDRRSSGAWRGGVEGQSVSFVASWSESLARVPLNGSLGSWRWGLLGAQKHAESPRTLEDTSSLMTGGGAGGGGRRGGDEAKGAGMHGRHAVQDSPGKVQVIEKIESGSTLSSPSSLLDYFSPSSKRSLATAREGENDCSGHDFQTPEKSRWW